MVFALFRQKDPMVPPRMPATLFDPTAPAQAAAKPVIATGASRKDRVAQAFKDLPLDGREVQAILALLDHSGSTAVEMSRACNWADSRWQTQMLLLCQRRRHYFWPDGVTSEMTNGMILTALTEYDEAALTFRPRKDVVRVMLRAVRAAV